MSIESAHARLAELEAAVAGRRLPRPVLRWRWGRALVVMVLAIAAGVALTGVLLPRRHVILGLGTPPDPIPAGLLELADAVPIELDADTLYVCALRPGEGHAPLHVVAVDRKTLTVRWRAGPYEARPGRPAQLSRHAAVLVFLDGARLAHGLDPSTGREISGPQGPADRVCEAPGARPCDQHAEDDPRAASLFPESSRTVLRDGETSLTIVESRVAHGPGVLEHALVWNAEGHLAWQGGLVPRPRAWAPSPNAAPRGRTALSRGRILHVYPMPAGDHRLAIRVLSTGVLLADAPLDGLDYGSTVRELTANGDDGYLLANRSLYVLDASTGGIRRRLDTF